MVRDMLLEAPRRCSGYGTWAQEEADAYREPSEEARETSIASLRIGPNP
jgi:hypothetical protein